MKLWCLYDFSSQLYSAASQRVTTYIKSPDSHGGTETRWRETWWGNWATEQLLCRNLWEDSEKLKSAGPTLALKKANEPWKCHVIECMYIHVWDSQEAGKAADHFSWLAVSIMWVGIAFAQSRAGIGWSRPVSTLERVSSFWCKNHLWLSLYLQFLCLSNHWNSTSQMYESLLSL